MGNNMKKSATHSFLSHRSLRFTCPHQLDRTRHNPLQTPPLSLPNPMLQIQQIPNFITRHQHTIQILLRVRRTHTEPHPARHQRCRGVRDNDDGNRRRTVTHHAVEHVHLAKVENEKRDDGRCGVAVGDEPKLDQAAVEVARVEGEATQALAAFLTRGEGGC